MPNRYLIIHGHFYQPPRENPWILAIEPQETAAPFENWNLRINRECYAPNARSRLLASDGSILKLANNYQYLNFDFGPTLLSWMEKADPDTYDRIIKADQEAAAGRDGHGPAMAQVYNHIIMPLANIRDRRTQIRWGIFDFETRFGRKPEGMWLAETAADLTTLRLLSEEGIKYTVLAQGQAEAVRPLSARLNLEGIKGTALAAETAAKSKASPGSSLKTAASVAALAAEAAAEAENKAWLDVSGGRIDPREPYRVFWGEGPEDYIDVFFYDGPVSRAIAFEKLLSDGNNLLGRIEMAFGQPKADNSPRLVNLATDGESYGHHFLFGDMALAWLFDHLEKSADDEDPIIPTNYGQYLALFPPVTEARIIDNTSWSCAHGVERWRADCGCKTGGLETWNQKWRAPLREGLDWLSSRLAETFEKEGGRCLVDPWAARDDYIRLIINDYAEDARNGFLEKHQRAPLSEADRASVLKLLEAQLMGLYMFTSCGWFFDEISGLEPVQNLRYALRAMELAQPYCRTDLVEGLLKYLADITPNDTDYKSGLDVWRRMVAPDSLSGRCLAAHWAAAHIIDAPAILEMFGAPRFETRKVIRISGDNLEVMAGAVELFDRRLAGGGVYLCLAIYSGSTHLAILVGEPEEPGISADWTDERVLQAALGEELSAISTLSIWDSMVRLMPLASRFVLDDLLPHCRHSLLSALVTDIYDNMKDYTREVFHRNQHLLMMHRSAGSPIHWVERFIFRVMGESELKRILAPADFDKPVNLAALANMLNKRGLVGIAKDEPTLAELSTEFFEKAFQIMENSHSPERLMDEVFSFIKLIRQGDFAIDLWDIQNQWYDLTGKSAFMKRLSKSGLETMLAIGDLLGFSKTIIDKPEAGPLV